MNIRSVGNGLARILETLTGSNGSLRAPSISVTVDDGKFDPYALVGTIDFNLNHPSILVWNLHDHQGRLIYQSTDYELSDDGCTATFKYDFPAMDNGDRFTLTQDAIVSSS